MSGATLDLVVRYLASRTGAAGGAGATDTAVRAGTTVAQPGDGAGLYATSCATCHGAQGGGDGHNAEYLPVPPPPHTSSEYQETHLASDCYVNGRMTCTDCHDPHSQTYRDAFGRPLAGRFDDGQCTACHPSKAERPATHTHHPVASPGSNCVACHMPYLQHPSVGRAIPFGRADHAITIPRPALDAPQRIVGACAQCHRDRSLQQLDRDITAWWGEPKPVAARARALMAARAEPDRAAAATLVLADDPAPQQLAQFAGLGHVFLQRLSADMPELEPADREALAAVGPNAR